MGSADPADLTDPIRRVPSGRSRTKLRGGPNAAWALECSGLPSLAGARWLPRGGSLLSSAARRRVDSGHHTWNLRSEGCSQPLRGRGTNGRCPKQAVVVKSAALGQGLARCARPQQTALASRTNQRSRTADDDGTAAFPQGASVAALQRCIVARGRPPLAANLPIKVRHAGSWPVWMPGPGRQ